MAVVVVDGEREREDRDVRNVRGKGVRVYSSTNLSAETMTRE
jgi:hypothetical protein